MIKSVFLISLRFKLNLSSFILDSIFIFLYLLNITQLESYQSDLLQEKEVKDILVLLRAN